MKKGFTLVEIIGVIVILGLLALLAFPLVLNMIGSAEQEIDEATKKLIYTASSQYVTKYQNDFPKLENQVYCITVRDLAKEDFVSSSITNLDTAVKITFVNQKYEYEILSPSEECTPTV